MTQYKWQGSAGQLAAQYKKAVTTLPAITVTSAAVVNQAPDKAFKKLQYFMRKKKQAPSVYISK